MFKWHFFPLLVIIGSDFNDSQFILSEQKNLCDEKTSRKENLNQNLLLRQLVSKKKFKMPSLKVLTF